MPRAAIFLHPATPRGVRGGSRPLQTQAPRHPSRLSNSEKTPAQKFPRGKVILGAGHISFGQRLARAVIQRSPSSPTTEKPDVKASPPTSACWFDLSTMSSMISRDVVWEYFATIRRDVIHTARGMVPGARASVAGMGGRIVPRAGNIWRPPEKKLPLQRGRRRNIVSCIRGVSRRAAGAERGFPF